MARARGRAPRIWRKRELEDHLGLAKIVDQRSGDEQPRNAYEIAQAIWGNVAGTQAFLTLSEVDRSC
ncbi:MAG TPA: hypothetical protein VFJ64_06585 [Solirubrobacterales bacterium]|nr:hypothetical protein [Solirubrobacterales bacterium]